MFFISGDSIADVKFNPDDLFLGSEDQDLEFEVSRQKLENSALTVGGDRFSAF